MRYNYKGFWGCDSCCDIEVHRRSDGKHVFIATEVPENRGTPITNYALSLPAIRLSPRPPIGFLRQAPSSVLLHSACQARH